MTSLNARFVDTIKKAGMHADVERLYLEVKESVRKYCIYRYQMKKRLHCVMTGRVRRNVRSLHREKSPLALKPFFIDHQSAYEETLLHVRWSVSSTQMETPKERQ